MAENEENEPMGIVKSDDKIKAEPKKPIIIIPVNQLDARNQIKKTRENLAQKEGDNKSAGDKK